MQKFLFIGVGGSGGRTLRFIYREIQRRLDVLGWENGMPRCISFLHIDLPEHWDGGGEDVPAVAELESDCYLNLGQQPKTYRAYDHDVSSEPRRRPGLAGWRVWPPEHVLPPYLGAGQVRSVGRLVGLARLGTLHDRVRSAAAQVATHEADDDMLKLRTLAQRQNPRASRAQTSGKAFVIASLGGGSGSGLLLEVIEVIKGIGGGGADTGWLADPVSVLYAPDVFDPLPESARIGVQPNALGAISELINAFHTTSLSEHEAELLAPAGTVSRTTGQRSSRVNYLVGRQNGAITFATPTDVFLSVGRALAAFSLDPQIQGDWDSYITTNVAPRPYRLGLLDGGDGSPALSFGYGTVTLGRHLFEDYAAERLARRSVDRLLYGHREGQTGGRSDEMMIDELVTTHRERFFDATGLYELSLVHNQVLDALRDFEEKGKKLDAVVVAVLTRILEEDQEYLPEQAERVFGQHFEAQAEAFFAEERRTIQHRFAQWSVDIVHQVTSATVAFAADLGLPVTLKLLDALMVQVGEAARELEHLRERYDEMENVHLAESQTVFRRLGTRIRGGHAAYAEAAAARRLALSARTEQDLFHLTSEVLDDLNRRLLPPLKTVVESFARRLELDKEASSRWTPRSVPRRLEPAPNEILIEPAEGFPEKLEDILMSTLDIEFQDDAIARAAEEIVTGVWPTALDTDPGRQTLVRIRSQWRPALHAGRLVSQGTGTAVFELPLDLRALLPRAQKWVRHRQGPIADHVRETLGGYLDPDHADSTARSRNFTEKLRLALRSAQPLINIDPNVDSLVHQPADSPRVATLGTIPMAADHPAYQDVALAVMEELKMDSVEVARHFDATHVTPSVEAMVFINRPFHPVIATSLMGPIAREWEKARGTEADFWRWRRARALPRFTPLPARQIEALITGYYVATLLGHLPMRGRLPWSEAPSQVWHPDGRWLSFPSRLLGTPVDHGSQVLPALLESFPLVLLDLAQGETSGLDAYERLVELGRPPWRELTDWVVNGRTAPNAPEPGEMAGDDCESRRRSAAAELERLAGILTRIRDLPLDADQVGVDRRREIAGLAVDQLSVVRAAVLNGFGHDDGDEV